MVVFGMIFLKKYFQLIKKRSISLLFGNLLESNQGHKDFQFKTKKAKLSFRFFVVPPGIEPGTQGFSVLCSTN